MELQNWTALVTGGTAGIGLESARLLAHAGANVIISGRDAERGAKAVAELGDNVRFIQADVGDLSSVKSLAHEATQSTFLSTTPVASRLRPPSSRTSPHSRRCSTPTCAVHTSWSPNSPRA